MSAQSAMSYCILFFLIFVSRANCYEVPSGFRATIKVFTPKGFEVSIPDSPNITLFAFHGQLNEEMNGPEAGTWSVDILKAKNGRWRFKNKDAEFKIGDTLYFWTTVNFNNVGYHQMDGVYKIERYNTADDSILSPVTVETHIAEPVTSTPITSCPISITTVNGQRTCKGQLIFDEQFNSQLDKQKWSHEVRIPLDKDDAEFCSYQSDQYNSYLESGHLIIRPSLLTRTPEFNEDSIFEGKLDLTSECTATRDIQKECIRTANSFYILPPVVSAKLNTKKSFKFRYGKVEIRAKMPKGDWIFPQMYLEPSENMYGAESFASGLMRVAFVRGNTALHTDDGERDMQYIGGEYLCGGAVLAPGNRNRNDWQKCVEGKGLWADDFHVYGMEWTGEAITMSVDGEEYYKLDKNLKKAALSKNIIQASVWSSDYKLSPFDKEFYISLGVGVGGIGDFPDKCKSGPEGTVKPWVNTSPKGERFFYDDVSKWFRTWDIEHTNLQVDYVRVFAI